VATPGVHGLASLQRALKDVDRDVRLGWRRDMRHAAEPVRAEAAALALSEIPRMASSPRWAGMRVGVTQKAVYVVPRMRSTKVASRRRPNLAELMYGRAMQPALEHNQAKVVAEMDDIVQRACAKFNRGGI